MEIRKCTKTDINEVYSLICELEETKFNFKEFEIAFHSKISNGVGYYILGIQDDQVIGFLSLNIDYMLHHANKVATLEELIVSAKYRSNGAGKVLLDNAVNYAKNSKCVIIELTSNMSREKAHNFYIKNGFKKTSFKFVKEL